MNAGLLNAAAADVSPLLLIMIFISLGESLTSGAIPMSIMT